MILYVVLALFIVGILLRKKFRKSDSESEADDSVVNKDEQFEYDVAIVGSGILGSSLATVLARDGRKVVVIEKNMAMPERFIGELLQPGGCKALKELGLEECINDIDAQDVLGYSLHGSKDDVVMPYPVKTSGFKGQSFMNGKFVMKLREKAMAEKNVTYVEASVSNLIESSDAIVGVVCKPKDGDEDKIIKAKLTVVSDGCFSQLRKCLSSEKPTQLSSFIGGLIKNCPTVRSDYVEAFLTHPNPVVFYQISSDATRVLIDVRERVPMKDMQNYLIESVCSQLPEKYREPFIEAVTSTPLRSMPNQMMPATPNLKKGAIVLGDALDLRHPITGNGMTVALRDVFMLRKLLKGVDNLANYKTITDLTKKFYSQRKKDYCFVVNVLANAMFELLSPKDEMAKVMQGAALKYYKLGGRYLGDAVELLASLNTKVLHFLNTFTCLTLYAVYVTFKENYPSSIIRSFYQSIRVCIKACALSGPLIWSEVKSLL